MASEGVVAATAAQSPGGSKVERAPPAAPAAQPIATANLLGCLFPTPKNLAMKVEDDFVEMEATGRGRRLQKLGNIFGETAASGGSKRTRAAVEEDSPTTADSRPSKKRAMTRDIPAIPAVPDPPTSSFLLTKRATPAASCLAFSSAAQSPTPAAGKRKRAGDDDEAATTAPPPAKKRAISCAAFTAPLRSTKQRTTRRAPSTAPLITAAWEAAWEASRAACAAPSVPRPPPVTEAYSPSIAASAASPALTSRRGATYNADILATVSTAATHATSVVALVVDPHLAPLFFMPGFSTPLFSVAAPPAPALAAQPAPTRTLLPSPAFTAPVPRNRC
ncbi:hypothetical protein MMC29_003138 [Sticta canariensis]|nr:hypothetical protein [Sticta canariensis]